MRQLGKRIYLVIGWTALALGAIGVLLPIMPTVPFLIVAFWAFSQSSPRLSRRILANRHVGPPLRAWLRHNAIPRRAKYIATIAMAGGCILAWWMGAPRWALVLQAGICLSVAVYILTRPDPPRTT